MALNIFRTEQEAARFAGFLNDSRNRIVNANVVRAYLRNVKNFDV